MSEDKEEIIRKIKVAISIIIGIPIGVLMLLSLGDSPAGTVTNMIANIFHIIEWFNN